MCLKKAVEKCLYFVHKLCKVQIKPFLERLSDDDDNVNLDIFSKFVQICSDTMLGVLHQLEFFKSHKQLVAISAQRIELRQGIRNKEDVDEYVINLLDDFRGRNRTTVRPIARVQGVQRGVRRRADTSPQPGPSRQRRRLTSESTVHLSDDDEHPPSPSIYDVETDSESDIHPWQSPREEDSHDEEQFSQANDPQYDIPDEFPERQPWWTEEEMHLYHQQHNVQIIDLENED